jgi:DNA repair photolyase
MVEVINVSRKSALLVPSTLECLSGLPTINLTAGCAHGCLYCYTRGYSSYPGEGKIYLYGNTFTKLRGELPRKRKRPVAVYFSPSSDLFQPVPEVLDLAYEVLKFLFENEVGVAFLTKGKIPDRHMVLLKEYHPLVRAQIGLTTLDEGLLKIFEPKAALPRIRVEQVRQLIEAGITTQVRLDPTLDELLARLSETGVKQIAASTLFLRPAIIGSLKRHLHDQALSGVVLSNFGQEYRLNMRAQNSPIIALPADKRKVIYNRLEKKACEYGIAVKVCACKNPDIAEGSCSIAGDWSQLPKRPAQQNLFEDSEMTGIPSAVI